MKFNAFCCIFLTIFVIGPVEMSGTALRTGTFDVLVRFGFGYVYRIPSFRETEKYSSECGAPKSVGPFAAKQPEHN